MLWAASYLVTVRGVGVERAAAFASLFFIGMTAGRFLAGFLSNRLGDRNMIRLGFAVAAAGVAVTGLPGLPDTAALAGLVIVGLGCAPVYPSIIHSTPALFGAENSRGLIGLEMASAYAGSTFMPPLFGVISAGLGMGILPLFVGGFLIGMILLAERVRKKTEQSG